MCEELECDKLLPVSKKMIEKIHDGLNTRFAFPRHHPIYSVKTEHIRKIYGQNRALTEANIPLSAFKNEFVFKMLCLLTPAHRSLNVVKTMINKVDFTKPGQDDLCPTWFPSTWRSEKKLRDNHFKLVKAAC